MGETIAGIILAGGRAVRMGGGDKGLGLLSGRPLLAHVIDRLAPQVDLMALNANGDPARLEPFGLPVVADPLPGMGPLGGVLAGMRWAERQDGAVGRIVTVACDTPFFPHHLVARLRGASSAPGRIVVSRSGGRRHPTFALWPVALADDLQAFLEDAGASSMRAFAGERHEPAVADFAIDEGRDPFFNVNTPQQLEQAERLAREAGE